MPHPDILRVLNMTPAEWGALPFHDDTRTRLREKALAILKGDDIPVDASTKALTIQQAIIDADKAGHLTRPGFEAAMNAQAKFFGEADVRLAEDHESLVRRVEALETFKNEAIEQIRVMEDSRADFTKIVLDRLQAVEDSRESERV